MSFPPSASTATSACCPSNGTSGTLAGVASPNSLLVDTTNYNLYMNTNTTVSPVWTIIPTESVFINQATITLTSQTAAQALFLGTGGLTSGQITLPIGTYEFECEFTLTSMSATSGSFGFALGTANSAVIGEQLWSAMGVKSAVGTTAALDACVNTGANVAITAASTATAGWARIKGTFTLTTAGSVIPEVSLATAAAVVVSVGSYFKVRSLNASGTAQTAIGNWS
jgi:hypothetical protein